MPPTRQEMRAARLLAPILTLAISRLLGISQFTVKKHLQNIFEKMRVRSRCVWHSMPLTRPGALDPRGGC